MSIAALPLYVNAGKAGRSGSETLPEMEVILIPLLHFRYTLCARACRQYLCTGYWTKLEKKPYKVTTSYIPRGISVVGPQKLECHFSMVAQIKTRDQSLAL